MGTVELEAGEFYYADYGGRAGMALVLLHGMPSSRSCWAQAGPDLATAGAGQVVHRTRPQEVLAAVQPFLRRILAAAAAPSASRASSRRRSLPAIRPPRSL